MSDQRGKLRPVTIEQKLAVADAHTEHLNEELSQLKKNYNWTAEEALRLQAQLNSAHVQFNEQAELIQHLKENLKSAFHAGKLEGQHTLDLVLIELGQVKAAAEKAATVLKKHIHTSSENHWIRKTSEEALVVLKEAGIKETNE